MGLIGATLGAGIGISNGVYGLGIDALKSVRLVTATGAVVTASATQHPDLFWGVRGAGANLGIVTAATFALQDAVNDGAVAVASFVYPAAANRSVLAYFHALDGDALPPALALQLTLAYNATVRAPQLHLALYYFGRLADFQPHVAAAQALGAEDGTPAALVSTPALYAGLENGQCGTGGRLSGATLGLARTDVAALQGALGAVAAFAGAQGAGGIAAQSIFQRYGNGRARARAAGATAFAWRDVGTWWLHLNVILRPGLEAPGLELARGIRAGLQAASGGRRGMRAYVNYALGDEGPAAWWSEGHVPRLVALKAKWDPQGLFGAANPIPLPGR